ncbi:hypothetical protein [Natrinema gelatinilyticum]|uniref:hypothetical protein n=1 Tax=Natrinema gelatinilyticum TaxID=2961571 RepID=UPI0020C45F2F|nr:hypothetical protein [Natrinema gelatinilyticum]
MQADIPVAAPDRWGTRGRDILSATTAAIVASPIAIENRPVTRPTSPDAGSVPVAEPDPGGDDERVRQCEDGEYSDEVESVRLGDAGEPVGRRVDDAKDQRSSTQSEHI